MIGIWVLSFLEKVKVIDFALEQKRLEGKRQKKFSLLEFGPGKGTLMGEVLRVLS